MNDITTPHVNVVLLGPPGSGKGTQAALLGKEFSLFHFSTGEMFREAVRQGSDLGRIVEEIMRKGELVPDDVLYSLVKQKVASVASKGKGILFDGYPRTLVQCEQLDEILAANDLVLQRVVFIDVPEDILVKRLSGRLYCPKCSANYNEYYKPPKTDNTCDECSHELARRSEDYPEAIQERLNVYKRQTLPLLNYYRGKEKLSEVNGGNNVDVVFNEICVIMRRFGTS